MAQDLDTKLDNLARMVGEGFTGTNERIDMVSDRIDTLQEEMLSRFTAIENRLSALESVIDQMRKEIQELHKESLQNELDIREIRLRVERLEKHLGLSK